MAWRKAPSDTERAAHNEECHLVVQDVGGRSQSPQALFKYSTALTDSQPLRRRRQKVHWSLRVESWPKQHSETMPLEKLTFC